MQRKQVLTPQSLGRRTIGHREDLAREKRLSIFWKITENTFHQDFK